jgi:uncharacterized repeat protein (TIGR01451 family)
VEHRKAHRAGPAGHAALLLSALTFALLLAFVPGAGAADPGSVTFSSTSTFPVPPVSSFVGGGGGDGWGVALTQTLVFNVFHHSADLDLACHYQVNIPDPNDSTKTLHAAASPCWGSESIRIYTRTNDQRIDFSASGQPGMYLDQSTGKLYVYATRTSDATAGVVCIDTNAIDPAVNPTFDAPSGQTGFCGFTELSAIGEAPNSSWANLGAPALVGTHLFAFNYVSGHGTTGTYNRLLCFDVKALTPCDGQPYAVFSTGESTVNVSTPSPSIAAIGSKVIIPFRVGSTDEITCFDASASDYTDATKTACSGTWPIDITQYASGYGFGESGPPFPMLSATGTPTGFCLSTGSDPCWDLTGTKVDPSTLPNLSSAILGTEVWNGPAVVIGPRVYLANRFGGGINCYDFSTLTTCQLKDASGKVLLSYPLALADSTDWYTVNVDPQRPTCLWANSDHRQIANFDAFTGGACGQGPIRVVTGKLVGTAPQCFPSKFVSLKIDDPAPTAYTSGSVVFADSSGNPLQGSPSIPLNDGTADLSSLHLSTDQALPQFLITLTNGGDALRPQAVTVTVTWTGTFDPTCATGGTTIDTPPATTPPPPPPAPPTPNIRVTVSGPPVARVGNNVTFTATVTNTSNTNEETGAELKAPIPAGSTLVSVKGSQGVCPTGTQVFCALGTIATGASATVTTVVTANQAGTLTFNPTIAGDYDTSAADNSTSVSTPVEQPGATPPAPPAPTTPGTVNAISVGTVVVNGVTIPPDTYFILKTGDTVQLNGQLVFTTIAGSVGIFSNVPFTGLRTLSALRAWLHAAETGPTSSFTVTAPVAATDTADLTLTGGDFSGCSASRRLSANPKPSSPVVVRQLWGHAHGNFRTTGHYSSATIRGTIWGVQDRCDGTLTTAVDDVVTVADTVLGKTVSLNPGQTYLAKPKPFTPPTQKHKPTTPKTHTKANTADSVRASGLVWAGHRFKSERAFSVFLSDHGSSWTAWAKKHPLLAAALATR